MARIRNLISDNKNERGVYKENMPDIEAPFSDIEVKK